MGTAISFDVRPPLPGPRALGLVVAWLHHVDATFSTYRVDSDISRFGRGELGADDLSVDVQAVLHRCHELADLTDGAFDAFGLPERNGTTLDPSGYVKGWSLERAALILEAHGAVNFCLNAAGDVLLRGQPDESGAWHVGIRHPTRPDALSALVHHVGSGAVATSASYERGAHVIDPRTDRSAVGLAGATIVGSDLGDVDAFATAAFVMGIEALDWIEDHAGYEAYLATRDGRALWSSGFDRFRPPSPEVGDCSVCRGVRPMEIGLGQGEESGRRQGGDR